MITIKNNLNQPLMVGERHLAAGGEMKVKVTDADIERLAGAGHVSINEPEPPSKDADKTENKEPKK